MAHPVTLRHSLMPHTSIVARQTTLNHHLAVFGASRPAGHYVT